MKFLRHIGLVSSLAIGGVVGGLMAPLSSEANTTVTFQVDSGAVATVLNVAPGAASTCTVPAGYSACYALPTGGTYTGSNSRSYTIMGYSGSVPRLLVTDTGGMDNLTFTTVEFAPSVTTGWGSNTANCGACTPTTSNAYGENHDLHVVITHTFDQAANVKTIASDTATSYKFALRASGMFKGNPTGYSTPTPVTGSGDFVEFTGDGIFGSTTATTPLLSPFPTRNSDGYGDWPACDITNSKLNFAPSPPAANPTSTPRTPSSDVNYCPLRKTTAGTSAPTSSFSSNPALEQVNVTNNPYPSYFCDNSIPVPPGTATSSGSATCKPTVILRLNTKMYGPDSWVFSSSGSAAGGSCNLHPPGPPVSTPAVPCQKKANKNGVEAQIATFNLNLNATDMVDFGNENAENTGSCVGAACFPVPGSVGSHTFNGHDYIVIELPTVGMSWSDARTDAVKLGPGWDLATITSEGEQAIINSLLPNPADLAEHSTVLDWRGTTKLRR